MTEFSYVSTVNQIWTCVECSAEVPSENMGPGWRDANGQPATLYAPASRYWLPGSKPGQTAGVFCGPECSKIHSDIVKALFPATPIANNEHPEGL